MKQKIPFIDLSLRPNFLNYKINCNVKNLIKKNKFILGSEINKLEFLISKIFKTRMLTCSNGTDALILSLLSLNIKKNDIVFVPSFTFTATVECIAFLGAIPFFIDINKRTLNICHIDLEQAIQCTVNYKNNKYIIAVDLFGKPAPRKQLFLLSKKYNIPLIFDAAQSFGSKYKNKNIGNLGNITTTSFFPTKSFSCFGDGGAIFTKNKKLYNKLISLRNHGSYTNKYKYKYIGMNARLDTIQGLILLEKLKYFPNELVMRNNISFLFDKYLNKYVYLIKKCSSMKPTHSQYAIILKSSLIRKNLKLFLKKNNIHTNIYYPIPLHNQKIYKNYPKTLKDLPITQNIAKKILNLPIYPYIKNKKIYKIIFYILKYLKK